MTQTVLVTGASGFIAAHVIKEFLTAGYNVVGTVRSEATAAKVKAAHSAYAGDKLSFAIVPDIIAPGAFDEAVKNVDGVIHTASPFFLTAKDFEKELWGPAVQGTTSVLNAVKTHNSDIKRIVITSSFSSILDYSTGLRPGYVYSEKDWNPMTKAEAKDPIAAYNVSKVLAEKAAFDFVKNEKPNFSVATLTPPMVYGPLAQDFDSLSKLNTSSADFYRLFNGSETKVPETGFWVYVDVRDLALAHRLAFESPNAANQRFAITNGNYSYSIFCDIIRKKFPELADKVPSEGSYELPKVYNLDNSKSIKELGLTYHTIEETVVDTVRSLRELENKLG